MNGKLSISGLARYVPVTGLLYEHKLTFKPPRNPMGLYQHLIKQIYDLKQVYRVGPVPGSQEWEYGPGGTFFSFTPEIALQYGNALDTYRVLRRFEPIFCLWLPCLETGDVEAAYGLCEDGLINMDDTVELGKLALERGYDGVADTDMQRPLQIWIDNNEIDDTLELVGRRYVR